MDLIPYLEGTYSQWVPSNPALPNHEMVDDYPTPDDDASYVYSRTAGHRDTYHFWNVPADSQIVSVTQKIRARQLGGIGSRTLRAVCLLDGILYPGSLLFEPSCDWADYYQDWPTEPTGTAWSAFRLNGAEFGMVVVDAGLEGFVLSLRGPNPTNEGDPPYAGDRLAFCTLQDTNIVVYEPPALVNYWACAGVDDRGKHVFGYPVFGSSIAFRRYNLSTGALELEAPKPGGLSSATYWPNCQYDKEEKAVYVFLYEGLVPCLYKLSADNGAVLAGPYHPNDEADVTDFAAGGWLCVGDDRVYLISETIWDGAPEGYINGTVRGYDKNLMGRTSISGWQNYIEGALPWCPLSDLHYHGGCFYNHRVELGQAVLHKYTFQDGKNVLVEEILSPAGGWAAPGIKNSLEWHPEGEIFLENWEGDADAAYDYWVHRLDVSNNIIARYYPKNAPDIGTDHDHYDWFKWTGGDIRVTQVLLAVGIAGPGPKSRARVVD